MWWTSSELDVDYCQLWAKSQTSRIFWSGLDSANLWRVQQYGADLIDLYQDQSTGVISQLWVTNLSSDATWSQFLHSTSDYTSTSWLWLQYNLQSVKNDVLWSWKLFFGFRYCNDTWQQTYIPTHPSSASPDHQHVFWKTYSLIAIGPSKEYEESRHWRGRYSTEFILLFLGLQVFQLRPARSS